VGPKHWLRIREPESVFFGFWANWLASTARTGRAHLALRTFPRGDLADCEVDYALTGGLTEGQLDKVGRPRTGLFRLKLHPLFFSFPSRRRKMPSAVSELSEKAPTSSSIRNNQWTALLAPPSEASDHD
jgi:hypothetical protein